VRGHAGIGRARAAGPALLAIAAAALCLAGPAAASAAQQPTGTALASSYNGYGDLGDGSSTMFSTTPVAVDLPAGTRGHPRHRHRRRRWLQPGVDVRRQRPGLGRRRARGAGRRQQTTFKSPTPVPVDLPAGTRVTAITAGVTDSLALAVPKPVGPIVSGYRANKCAADSGDSAVNDTPITIATCDGSPGQNWTVTSSGTLKVNGKCLDIYRDEKTNKAPVELWTCTGGAHQQWRPTDGALVNPVSGKCLDDPGSAPLPAPGSSSTPAAAPTSNGNSPDDARRSTQPAVGFPS
jgi:hypothetical protein